MALAGMGWRAAGIDIAQRAIDAALQVVEERNATVELYVAATRSDDVVQGSTGQRTIGKSNRRGSNRAGIQTIGPTVALRSAFRLLWPPAK